MIKLLDGGMGTLLQSYGLPRGLAPERVNLDFPELVLRAHEAYFEAGADYVTANCFSANPPAFRRGAAMAEESVLRGMELARRAAEKAEKAFVLGLGPAAELMEPYGELTEDELFSVVSRVCELGAPFSPEFILIETVMSLDEAVVIAKAAKEASGLPVAVTMSFDKGGRTMFGNSPEDIAGELEEAGVFALGLNCGFGPDTALPIFEKLRDCSTLRLIAQPNAGLPRMENGEPVYDLTPGDFAREMLKFTGASYLGGCCGTTPEHIAALKQGLGMRNEE